jgi:hypothetical protein
VSEPDPNSFLIFGTVMEEETGRPLPDLVVRAFDRDLIADDRVGFATTDAEGRFEIRFGREAFRDLREARPDLYLRIYEPTGIREVHHTSDAIRWNASTSEHYRVRIPARALRVLGTR